MRTYQSQFILLASLLMLLLLGACDNQAIDSNQSIFNELEHVEKADFYRNRSAHKQQAPPASFCLIYEGELESLLADESSLRQLMQKHNLEIADYFEVSKNYNGLTLEAYTSSQNAVELGKTLSLVNQVSMITIKESVEEYM